MSEYLTPPATAVAAANPLVEMLQQEPTANFETPQFTGKETSEDINDHLFGEAPATSEWPTHIWERREKPVREGMVGLKPLASEISAESLATIASMREKGIETKPRFALVMGNPWGEKEAHLRKAALDVAEKGVAAPFGDGVSYVRSLLRQCANVGVQPVLFVGRELREHPAVLATLEKYGLDPEETLPTGHDLGILHDLSYLYTRERDTVATLNEYRRIKDELLAAWAGHEFDDYTREEMMELDRYIAEAELETQRCQEAITKRRREEDHKIGALIEATSLDPDIDGVIAITNTFDGETQKELGKYFIDLQKAVDGQSKDEDRPKRRWKEATSEAVIKSAEYLFRLVGRNMQDIPTRLKRLFGKGPRVGQGVSELHEMGYIYANTKEVTEGAANPGIEETALVIGAVPVARILKANSFTPARIGMRNLLGRRARKLVIVDAGVSTVFPEDGSAPYTQSNLDPASIPKGSSVIATNDVGKVTSAIIVNRVVDLWAEKEVEKFLASLETSDDSRTRQLGGRVLAAAGI